MRVSESKHAGRNGWRVTLRTPKNMIQDPHTRAVLGLSIPRRALVIIYVDQHSLWKAGGQYKDRNCMVCFLQKHP